MNRLTESHLKQINHEIAQAEGERSAVRSGKELSKIADSPYELDERGFYICRTVTEKAARLAAAIWRERPFERCNLKTALVAMLALLELNRIVPELREEDLSRLAGLLTEGASEESFCGELKKYCHQETDKKR